MMKICHLTSVHRRHDTRIFIKQCVSLARAGYDVTLIVADGKGYEEEEGVKIIDVGVSHFGRAGRISMTGMAVYKEALNVNADIYHFHDPEFIPEGLLLKARGKKVIYDVHEDYPKAILSKHYLPPWMCRLPARGFEIFEGVAAKRFSGLVSATPAIAKRFEKLNKNTITVQNFPIIDELLASETVSWKKRSNAVAYVGVIGVLRGVKEMVEAAELASKKTDVQLLLAGDFFPQSLKEEVESMEGWKRTKYLGYLPREKVAQLFDRIKAGLVLIHSEPRYQVAYPVKLFEYMSSGVPVIASNFPLWREIVESADCGLLVNPMKPIEIADAVIYIFENPKEAEEMGKRGLKAVEKSYNWSMEEKKLLGLYENFLS